MKSRHFTYFIVLTISIFCVANFYAFDQKEDANTEDPDFHIPPLVQKELDLKIQKYQQTILDRCRMKALDAAESYVDSLVAEELKLLAGDTLKFPAKPTRPNLREPIILNDSTAISPIIK